MANDITVSFSATETIAVTFAAANPITAATQAEVNTGTATGVFVNPTTFAGASKWDTKINHALATAASDFLVASGNGSFVKKTLAETKTILDLPYDTDLADSATIALDLTSRRDGISSGNSTQTATTITLSNIPTKGVRHISIGKTNAADLVVTLAGTNMQFEFFDSTNNCYTTGTNCTLSAGAGTSFAINLVFTGLTSGANARIQVAGTYNAFA